MQQMKLKMGAISQATKFTAMLNQQIFNQMKENANKDNQQTQLLLALAEEVMHDQDQEEVKEDEVMSKSSNSIWNKTMLSKVLQTTNLGDKQQLKTMIREKRYAEVLERCLRALIDLQNQDIADSHEFYHQSPRVHSPDHHMTASYNNMKRPMFDLSSNPKKLNVSQRQEKQTAAPLEYEPGENE